MEQVGVVLTQGPMDWQIVQQDEHGHGRLEIGGRWAIDVPGRVEVRLVREDTSAPVSASLDWQGAETRDDGTWSATLESIPAGGLYRLETRVSAVDAPAYEWSCRGDMRHFLGVGDLWVIAGQSNSAGYGRDAVEDPPELGVHVFRNSGKWSVAAHPLNESTDTAHPVNREGANPGHSPYLAFAKAVRRETGVPIGLVQTALGGSPLSQWNPTEPGDSVLFDNMIHCVGLVGGGVRGILWYQGESDGGPGIADTYR